MLEIPPLPDATILLVEVGSTAHGTGLPGGEDHDEMGVVVEGPQEVLGVDERVTERLQLATLRCRVEHGRPERHEDRGIA